MRNIITDFQNSDTCKIQLAIEINFISSINIEKDCVMHSKSNNIKFVSYNGANEVVKELFDSLKSSYQNNSKTPMKESEFIFD